MANECGQECDSARIDVPIIVLNEMKQYLRGLYWICQSFLVIILFNFGTHLLNKRKRAQDWRWGVCNPDPESSAQISATTSNAPFATTGQTGIGMGGVFYPRYFGLKS
ncbi:hypothetical protein ACJX0J_038962 [Zea mays]